MPPNKQLLQRELAVENARQDIADVQDVVRDMVDEGTQLLARLVQTVGQNGEPRRYHTSLLLLLRHVLEQLDAVDELLRQGITVPAMLNIRAIIEAHAQMLYMSAVREPITPAPVDATVPPPNPIDPATNLPVAGAALEQLRDFRGGAYLVADMRQQLQESERLDANAVGAWLKRLTGKATGPAMISDPANQARLQADIAAQKARLADAENAAIDAAFTTARGKKGKFDPAWYELQGGPGSVYALTKSVGLVGEYELFYSPASALMHGQDIRGQIGAKRAGGGHSLAPLRTGRKLEEVVSKLVIEVIRIYHHAIQEMRPADKSQWDEWTKRWTAILR